MVSKPILLNFAPVFLLWHGGGVNVKGILAPAVNAQ